MVGLPTASPATIFECKLAKDVQQNDQRGQSENLAMELRVRFLSRRPKNPLRNVNFTDGKIISVEQCGDRFTLCLVDYDDWKNELEFGGVSRLFVSPDVIDFAPCEVLTGRFSRAGSKWVLRVSDHDDELMLEIEYDDVKWTMSKRLA